MPTSQKRRRNGKPVRHASPPPVRRDRTGLAAEVPPLRLEVADPVGVPVWYAGADGRTNASDYYRAALPARSVGGAFRSALPVGFGGRRPVALPIGDPAALGRLAAAAEAGERVVLFGPSAALNIVPFRGPNSGPVLTRLVEALNAAGCPCWAESDDDYGAVPYADWLLDDVVAEVGRPLAPWERARVRVRLDAVGDALAARFAAFLAAAAGVVVATAPLAAVARRHNPVVRVVENAVDPAGVGPARRPAGAPVAVGFGGSRQKFLEDLPLALPGLLAAARGGAALHFWGGHPADDGPGRPRPDVAGLYALDGARYRFWPPVPTARYQRQIGALDVAVAPLAPDSPLNACRSMTKWAESALHGTAMVVQDLAPYACVTDGATGLKATDPDEWTEAILQLVGDAPLRRRIGAAAREAVLAEHTIAARAPAWRSLVAAAAALGPKRGGEGAAMDAA